MHLTRVSPKGLELRLDAQFYRPDYLAAEQAVRDAARCGASIGTLGTALSFFETGVSAKTPGRLPLLKTRAISDGCLRPYDFDETVEAPQDLSLLADDVLLCTYGTGSIGKVAFVGADGANRTVDYTIAILRSDGQTIHAGYVAAFLGCTYGQAQVARHTKGTTGITFVLRSDLVRAVFPRFSWDAQRYIGDKVRQAERLRERARRLRKGLIEPFDAMVSERVRLLGSSRSWRIAGRVLEHRLDPGANHVRLVALREDLRAAGPTRALGNLIANPIPAGVSLSEFAASGPLYVRISDFDRGYWDSSAASLSAEHHLSNAKGHFRPGDVVFARIGNTLGKVGFADRHVPTSSLSNNCSLIRPLQEEHGPWIFWCLKSALGDVQTGCLKSQTAQPKISNEDIEAIVLPNPDLRPDDFNERTEQHFLAARCADWLTSGAKLLVEHLIDGRITEAEIGAAQKALEAGDRSADRAILQALRQSDAPDAKPLIADLDALYGLVDEPEENHA